MRGYQCMEFSLMCISILQEEVIVRLTQPAYLLQIRKTVATKHAPEVESQRE